MRRANLYESQADSDQDHNLAAEIEVCNNKLFVGQNTTPFAIRMSSVQSN